MLNENEFEIFEKTELKFQLDNNVIVLTDLKIYVEENEKVTFSFYLEEKDYYELESELTQLLSDYIFENIPNKFLDQLEAFTEFVYCDSMNNKFSYDYQFHIKTLDSLNRDRIQGKLYSPNPKRNLIRVTDDEKIMITLIRSINNDETILFLSKKDVNESYQSFIDGIDERTSYERSLENFFNNYINIEPNLNFIDISEKFEELTKYAKENYLKI